MNAESAGLVGMVVFLLLLIVTGNAAWLFAVALCGIVFGWEHGKRYIPDEVN